MKTELLVRSRKEDPEVQQERAQAVKAKSVSELSQIKSFDDIPEAETLRKPLIYCHFARYLNQIYKILRNELF